MPDPTSPYTLVLTEPSYRKWLAPDTTEIRIEIRGGDDQGLAQVQANLSITEFDTQRTQQRLIVQPPFSRELVFSSPRLHSGGEILVLLENPLTGDVFAEGRWNLRSLDVATAKRVSYFDSRRVLIRSGVACFPLFAWCNHVDGSRESWETMCRQLSAAGYEGVVVPHESMTPLREIAAIAEAHQLGLVSVLDPEMVDPTALATKIITYRDLGNLWGFLLDVSSETADSKRVGEIYNLLRSKCNDRFCILHSPHPTPDNYDDVLARDLSKDRTTKVAPSTNTITFGTVDLDKTQEPESFRSLVFSALIDNVSGLLFRGELTELIAVHNTSVVQEAKTAGRLICLGTPIEWTRADNGEFASQNLRVWARRDTKQFLFAVRHNGEIPATVALPVPVPQGKIQVVGGNLQLDVQSGLVRIQLEPGQVLVLTNGQ